MDTGGRSARRRAGGALNIGLIDVDGKNGFPNLALMRISAYHKSRGDHIEWNRRIKHSRIRKDKPPSYAEYWRDFLRGGFHLKQQIKPILFNTPMTEAIRDGTKTETRRLIKPQPRGRLCYIMAGSNAGKWHYPPQDAAKSWGSDFILPEGLTETEVSQFWTPPCHTDDVLYVRETWCRYWGLYWHKAGLEVDENGYCKDGFWVDDISELSGKKWVATKAPNKWRPAIHMPREAARLFLKVTNVSVERLQRITEEGARAEGVEPLVFCSLPGESPAWEKEVVPALPHFPDIWNNTLKRGDRDRYGWSANPYVWVIKFQRCEKPEEFDSGK